MKDGNYCFPLDIFDDHSRYVIRIKPSLSTSNLVLPTFREAFYEFGIPNSILSDNGAQFAGLRQGYTQFEKWLMNHDVLPIHGRIKHPQTQEKIEQFHRAMNQELLKHYTPKDISDAERVFQDWRNCYNNERPHEALGMKCPSDIYVPSNLVYCDSVEKYEYSGKYHVIKVNSWGYVRFDCWQIYFSETMTGEYIEFRPNPKKLLSPVTETLQSENLTYIPKNFCTEKSSDFNCPPLLEASLCYAPFGFQKHLNLVPNVYTMSLHNLFTMLLLTFHAPLHNSLTAPPQTKKVSVRRGKQSDRTPAAQCGRSPVAFSRGLPRTPRMKYLR